MHRFISFAVLSSVLACVTACSTAPNNPTTQTQTAQFQTASTQTSAPQTAGTFNDNELTSAISTHLGVTSESAASAIERLFRERGRPVGYITGEEGGGAFTVGARYGKGTLWMKNGQTRKVYWQGPTVGFDIGAEASKVFTLVYNLDDADLIYRRYPGVDGSAFLVAGMAINYQRGNGIILAPVRSGVGVRLGANVGYTSYTRNRSIIPL